MKVRFNKDTLLMCINRSLGCVSADKTYGAIEGILLTAIAPDQCKISAYDLEKGIKTTIDADVEEEGSVVINGNKLASIVRLLPSDVTIETSDAGVATITSGRSRFQLHYLPGEDFPQLPEFSPDRSFSISQKMLKTVINQTAFAVSKENDRPFLTGMYFEVYEGMLRVVACDSYRLAIRNRKCDTKIVSKNGETELKFIVPGKTINEIQRLLDDTDSEIKFSLTRKHVIFSMTMKYGDVEKEAVIFSRLIDSNYFEYERVIPKESKTFVTVSRELLEDALERASLVTEDKAAGHTKSIVKFSVKDEVLEISAVSMNGKVFDEIPAEKEGPEIEIGFACKYLLEILKGPDVDTLKLSLSSPLMSMIIEDAEVTDKDDSFVYLALPMKMKDNG